MSEIKLLRFLSFLANIDIDFDIPIIFLEKYMNIRHVANERYTEVNSFYGNIELNNGLRWGGKTPFFINFNDLKDIRNKSDIELVLTHGRRILDENITDSYKIYFFDYDAVESYIKTNLGL